MKQKKLLFTLATVAVLLIISCIITVASTVPAGERPMDLKVHEKSLLLEDAVYLRYYVPVDGTNGADVKMLFWLEPQSEYVEGTQDYTISPNPGTAMRGSVECYVFDFRKLAAKQMTVDVYAKVYATDGENEYYSKLNKYSVLQYCYYMLGKTSTYTPDEDFENLLNSLLAYGAAAQEYFGENTDLLATDSFYQIKVSGTTLPDGSTSGLYKSGAQITVTAPATNAADEIFLYWQNSTGAQVGTEQTYTITVSSKNETYTAIYGVIEEPITDPLLFTELSDGTYSVKANPDVELPSAIAIPATYEGKAVTTIEDSAFLDCTTLTSISLPHGIKTIGDKAFSGCTGLSELELPETVKTIGTRAFYGCSGITEITIPASVTSIGTQIFYSCDNLNTVYYNSTYVNASNPFLAEKSIETVVFGGSRVPANIAYNNNYLKTVIIQDGVQYVDDYAFYGCTNLASVVIGNSVTRIDPYAFQNCKSLTSITIPDSVTSIGSYAFSGCAGLTSITIPDSVTSIEYRAFYNCTNLKKVYYAGTVEDWCKISFSDYDSSPMRYDADLYLNGELVTEVEIPDTITKIKKYAFYSFTSLTSITIPDSVTSIGDYAFSYCPSLTSITIPDSVTSIGNCAFRNCTSLTSITIPDSVTSIGSSAFEDCTSLTSVTIPDSVTSIGSSAFRNCTGLTGITIPDSVTSIGYYAFYNCTSLTGITIPDSVTRIGSLMFNNCTSLASITIPDSVTSIGEEAFYDCTSLTSITIPDSVTSIGSYAFQNCTSLKTVYYIGTAEQWAGIGIGSYNTNLTNATRYYYSETQPTTSGNYWHYVDGVPTAW